MEILVVEDEKTTLKVLTVILSKWGYDVITAMDGKKALNILQKDDAPHLVLLDWVMPGVSGVEICRQVRKSEVEDSTYLIMLTTRANKEDIVEGLQAGANDYIVKPFNNEELHARVNAGAKIIQLHQALEQRVQELEEALNRVQTLEGIIPICSYCKNIRDDENYWQKVEAYIGTHSKARFSHGICPDCYEKYVVPQLNEVKDINESKN
ncbi:MAG: PleD family two-component system response regulator [Fidelibacterota bacterium]